MESLYNRIIARILECEKNRRMFHLPVTEECYNVKHEDIEPAGSIITGDEWTIVKDSDYLHIRYVSKDKSRSFQDKPDMSSIIIKGVIAKEGVQKEIDYTYAWEER